jgi:hypothetical protein
MKNADRTEYNVPLVVENFGASRTNVNALRCAQDGILLWLIFYVAGIAVLVVIQRSVIVVSLLIVVSSSTTIYLPFQLGCMQESRRIP